MHNNETLTHKGLTAGPPLLPVLEAQFCSNVMEIFPERQYALQLAIN